MANVTGKAQGAINFTQTPSSGFLSGTALPINPPTSLSSIFSASGTSADQCDLIYAATLSFTGTTAQTLDLTALTDILGNAVNMARVRLIAIRVNSTTDAHTLTLGAAASNEWTALLNASGTLTLRGSTSTNAGFVVLVSPNTTGWVTSGSSKNLKLTPSATQTADIVIAGCSA